MHLGHESTGESARPCPMLPHRLSASERQLSALTSVANQRSLGGGGAGGDVCDGYVFWEADMRARGGQERTREASPWCPRPLKRGPYLGRLWIIPDARGHPFLGWVRALGRVFVRFDPSGRAGAEWVAPLEMALQPF
jgi:hypothetical protein